MVELMKIIMNDWFEKLRRIVLLVFLCARSGGCYLFLTLLLSMIQVRLSIILHSQFYKLRSREPFSLFRIASNKRLKISNSD